MKKITKRDAALFAVGFFGTIGVKLAINHAVKREMEKAKTREIEAKIKAGTATIDEVVSHASANIGKIIDNASKKIGKTNSFNVTRG